MKLKYIVDALNHYYLKKFPNAKGWFIGKESVEPTRVNAYKKYRAEIYYHTSGKNSPAVTVQLIDRCLEGENDFLKEKATTMILAEIFTNLEKLDEYETV